jgi:hypothetical protein
MSYENTLLPSRLLIRLLERLFDSSKILDYLWLAMFASIPIPLALIIGVYDDSDGFLGYGSAKNWIALVIALPLATLILRWIVKKIGPILSHDLPDAIPPVIDLFDEKGKEKAYKMLREAILSPWNLIAALVISTLIQFADVADLVGFYRSTATQVCPSSSNCAQELDSKSPRNPKNKRLKVIIGASEYKVEKDWSVAYLNSKIKVDKLQNAALNIFAYSVQFSLILIGFMQIIVIFRHNYFFLSHIYQRSRVAPGQESSYIHLNLDDPEYCFGFRSADSAFNVQVITLGSVGIFILLSRCANVGPGTNLFPDIGQSFLIIGWLVTLIIVSLPFLVKLLPRIPSAGSKKPAPTLVNYLREFLSDDAWIYNKNTTLNEEITAVAAVFAWNNFWPTGNIRAGQFYFLAFLIFFIALIPDLRVVNAIYGLKELPEIWKFVVSCVLYGLLALVLTKILFLVLRILLIYIDPRLVDKLPLESIKIERLKWIHTKTFISYRRKDTAGHAGRLYGNITDQIHKNTVFFDRDKINGGAKYMDVIIKAIESAKAMIVVIGSSWLNIINEQGKQRIFDPDDIVHKEVALGLSRGIRIYPVLVNEADMPSRESLPDDLKDLANFHAFEIRDSSWDEDIKKLILTMKKDATN